MIGACDPETGRLKELDTRSTLPDGFSGTNSCADVHVDPRGRFVYGSNRGHDSIAVFAWDSKNRIISLIQNQPVEGKTPRNFLIHGSGRFLLSANQNSDTITGFRLDPETGKLTFSGVSVRVGKPVCLVC